MSIPASALSLSASTAVGVEDVLAALDSQRDGLSSDEVKERLRRVGSNVLPQPRGPSLAAQLVAQLVHFFALMLWAAAGLALVGGLPALAAAIVVVIVVNALFSFAQEYRAERAIRALSLLLPETAVVRRGGRKERIPAADLVPGDVVLLAEGDSISADARVIRTAGLRVDNSLLTGESEPVERVADPWPAPPADIAEAPNVVFFGLSVALGTPARDGFLFSVGVIVALVPEGLLPTLSLSLAMSANRMARSGALVRRLESVETLGSTTVICTDKTGTLTENEMTARAIAIRGHAYEATGSGYNPHGTLLAGKRPLAAGELARIEPLLRAMALCNDAHLEQRDGRWRSTGDPTEGALLVLARKGGVGQEHAERAAPRVREFPFDSERRRMCTVHALPSGAFEVLVKGSPEAVLEACTTFDDEGRPVPMRSDVAEAVRRDVERLAADGLRVLALGCRELGTIPASPAEAEHGLELLGLVGMADPVRPEVPDAIARCRSAGIRVVMITGDHPSTARAVATRAGLADGRVLLGADLPESDDALAELLGDPAVSVLARVVPEQKLRIARAFQSRGEVVAMTGDGVNALSHLPPHG